jgi:hypothetical protein
MTFVVDTNVCIVANGRSHASPGCVIACVRRLVELRSHQIAIDDGAEILDEYKRHLHTNEAPLEGHAFYRWLVTNLFNESICAQVPMAPFPDDSALSTFDRGDRKFVQVALALSSRPPILNAVDSDWRDFETALAAHGVHVEFLCPEHV